jgi:hypothetical protein
MKTLLNILHARVTQFVALPLAVLVWFTLTDPSGGADTVLRLQLWAQALLVTGLAYLVAKALLGRTSGEALYDKAIDGNIGAGLAYVGVCLLRALVLVGLLGFFAALQQ